MRKCSVQTLFVEKARVLVNIKDDRFERKQTRGRLCNERRNVQREQSEHGLHHVLSPWGRLLTFCGRLCDLIDAVGLCEAAQVVRDG